MQCFRVVYLFCRLFARKKKYTSSWIKKLKVHPERCSYVRNITVYDLNKGLEKKKCLKTCPLHKI
jgi:hypothetical protein